MTRRDEDASFDTSHTKGRLGTLAVRGGATTALTRAVRAAIELGSTVVLARILGPSTFGLFGMASIVMRMIDLVRDLGLSAATIQSADVDHARGSALFWINALAGLVFAVSALVAAPLLAWFFDEPALLGVVSALSISFVFGGLSVQHVAIMKRQMRFGAAGLVEIASGLAGAASAITIAALGGGVWALVAAPIAGNVASTIASWSLSTFRPGPPRRTEGLGAMLGFGSNLVGFNLVNFFARNLDDVLIGRFLGTGVLGLYQKSYELMMLPLKQLNVPLGAVAVPTLSRLVDDPPKYREALRRALDLLLLATAPMTAVMFGSSTHLVRVVLGPDWSAAAPIFSILALSLFTQCVSNALGWLFVSQARTAEMLRFGVFASATAAACFVVGLRWGAIGVASAYTIGQVARTPLLVQVVGREGPVRARDVYEVAAPHGIVWVATAGATYAASAALPALPGFVALLAVVGVGATVACVTLAALPSGRASVRSARDALAKLRPGA